MAETKKQNLNAVTLVRVSTKKQGNVDRFGMDAQRESNRRIVLDNGFIVKKTIEYADVSGDAVMYTPEMARLQEYLRTPEMKGGNLVAKELSRLLRPNYQAYPLLQVFADQHISIHLPQYVLQLWTPEGRMLASVLCAADYNEAERIRTRCMGGREASRRLGYCASGGRTVPTGVTWDVKSKKWGYDPIFAPKIAEAFRLVAGGETNFQFIIDKLKLHLRPADGVPKRATPTALRRLLENRLFIGERVIDKKFDLSVPKEKLVFYRGDDPKPHFRNRPLIQRDPDEVIVTQVNAEPLVPVEVFERVQAILRAKSDRVHQAHALHQPRPKFTYRGLLFCGECGQPLYTISQTGGGYYRCRDHFPKRGGTRQCNSPSMPKHKLEAALDRLFTMEFGQDHLIIERLKQRDSNEGRKTTARIRQRLEERQKALNKKRDRIIEFALDGVINNHERDHQLGKVVDELNSIRAEMPAVECQLPDALLKNLLQPMKGFSDESVEKKHRLIASRFQEIRVRNYKVVSLYLLIGEAVMPYQPPCLGCGRGLNEQDVPWKYCEPCWRAKGEPDEADECWELGKRPTPSSNRQQSANPRVHPGVFDLESSRVTGSNDTSHGL